MLEKLQGVVCRSYKTKTNEFKLCGWISRYNITEASDFFLIISSFFSVCCVKRIGAFLVSLDGGRNEPFSSDHRVDAVIRRRGTGCVV